MIFNLLCRLPSWIKFDSAKLPSAKAIAPTDPGQVLSRPAAHDPSQMRRGETLAKRGVPKAMHHVYLVRFALGQSACAGADRVDETKMGYCKQAHAAARRPSVSPSSPRSRSPSVDSEAGVDPSARKSVVDWGRAIAQHWDSGSQGRAPRPDSLMQPAEHMVWEGQCQRELMHRSCASEASEYPERGASESIVEVSVTRGAIDSKDRQASDAGQVGASTAVATVSGDAHVARQPTRSAPRTTIRNDAEGGSARSVLGVGTDEGHCGGAPADAADAASSDSPVLCVPFFEQNKRKRSTKTKMHIHHHTEHALL